MRYLGLIVITILFVAVIAIAITNAYKINKNYEASAGGELRTFRSNFDPQTGKFKGFQDLNGNSQIKCPIGKKINMIGAYYDVFDPFGTCGSSVKDINPNFAWLCDPNVSSLGSCSTDSDCYGYNAQDESSSISRCNENGKCVLRDVGSSANPPPGLSKITIDNRNFFVNSSVCGYDILDSTNISSNQIPLPNPMCSPGGSKDSKCAMRDASGRVASKCDGRNECPDLSVSDFGTEPCPGISATGCLNPTRPYNSDGSPNWFINGSTKRQGYCNLPFLPGFPGGVPASSGTNNPDPQNSNIGYVLHGVYTCI